MQFVFKMIFHYKFRLVFKISLRRYAKLVSAEWLAEQIRAKNADLRILYASLDSGQSFQRCRIPSSFDFHIHSLRDSTYKHMLPSAEKFNEFVTETLFISSKDQIVVYDNSIQFPSFTIAARVWFMFKYFGFENVYLLNGGLKQWLKDGNSILHKAPKMNSSSLRFYYDRMQSGGRLSGQPRKNLIASYDEVNNFAKKCNGTLVDCRLESEKRGSIPGAQYFPISEILDPETSLLRSVDELRRIFRKYKIDLHRPIIAYCNRNLLASSFVFAARTVGAEKVELYDGGWSEWSGETAYKLKTPFKICLQYP